MSNPQPDNPITLASRKLLDLNDIADTPATGC
jgi:hypothetical protein